MATPEKIAQYKQLLINLLPKGQIWRPKEQPKLSALLGSEAEELARVDDRVKQMLIEVDPRSADETLEVWEKNFGLPDECTPEDQTPEERVSQLVQKITNIGGISVQFFEFLGLQLGFDINVYKTKNFLAGRARAGDPLTNYFNRVFVAGSECGMQLREVGWRYYFAAELPITAASHFVAGSHAGDPIRSFSNDLMECTIKKLKPANAGVIFKFIE